MSEPGGERRGPEDARWQRATFLELFFDLVFVFALSQVSIRLINDFNTGHELVFSEAAPTVLMFLALWILWLSMVALTSRLHPNSPPAQLMVFASMTCAVVMAVAVGRGFEQRAVIFAGAYAAARTSRALLVLAFRLTHQIPVPVLLSLVASSVPWIVGALVNTPWAWPGLTDIRNQWAASPREDVHHGRHGQQAASSASGVHAGVQGGDRRGVPAG